MSKILLSEKLNEAVWRLRIQSPRIAKKRRAGQFVMLRPRADSERIPLTIADADPAAGTIDLIIQVAGKTTAILAAMKAGEEVSDLAGPLGRATHIENFGHCLCVGGGVGIAPLYPIARALQEAGNRVTSVIGARSASLLILEQEMAGASERLRVTTDDGTKGMKGFATDAIKSLFAAGEKFDFAVVIGPAMMMKVTSQLLVSTGIKTMVSLNPVMVDGTGMCGGCRVSLRGDVKFACVDGPEFDAALIEWEPFLRRLGSYKEFEKRKWEEHRCRLEEAK